VKESSKIRIYTDGGCDVNPGGTGGWAFRILDGDRAVERSGRVEGTTNNRMELTAAIRALEMLKVPSELELFTDSQYLARGMSEWIHGWIRRNWALKDGSPVKNDDLWKRLFELAKRHQVSWTWVRGHRDDTNNVRVDHLVKKAMKGELVGDGSSAEGVSSVPPKVELIKRRGKPIAVTISLKPGPTVQMDIVPKLKIEVEHLQKLVEDLIAALRETEES
jgi:ribonuclease HI